MGDRLNRLGISILALLASPPAFGQPVDETAAGRHLFPLVADGGGYRSRLSLFVTNVAGGANRCSLDARGPGLDAGIFDAHPSLRHSSGGATLTLENAGASVVLHSGPDQALAFGYATLDCDGAVVARMLLSWHDGAAAVSMTELENAPPGNTFQVPVLPRLGMPGVLLANDGVASAACSIEAEDGDGASIGGASLTIPGESAELRDLSELVALPAGLAAGTARISCSRPVSALALPVNGAAFTALPAVPLDEESAAGHNIVVFPLLADGDGMRSQLLVTSLAEGSNSCDLFLNGPGLDAGRFHPAPGFAPDRNRATLTMAGHGRQIAILSKGEQSLGFGYGSMHCEGPVAARGVLTAGAPDNPLAMTVIPRAQQDLEFQFPAVTGVDAQALMLNHDFSGNARCGVEWIDFDGSIRGARQLRIAAYSSSVRFLGDLFDDPEGFVRLSCDTSVTAVSLPLSGAAFAALRPVLVRGVSLDPEPEPEPEPDPEPPPVTVAPTPSGGAPWLGDLLPFTETWALNRPIPTLQLPYSGSGDAPLRYTLEPGAPGLRFDPASRRLSGTPTAEGFYEMTYRVEDADGQKDFVFFNVRVAGPDTRPSFAGMAPPDRSFTLGEEIAPMPLPAARDGNNPIAYSFGPRVPGLRFDAATRRLLGSPWLPGAFDVTWTATDFESDSASLQFTITVEPDIDPDSLLDPERCANGVFVDEPTSYPELVADCRVMAEFANHFIRGGLIRDGNVVRSWGRGARQKLENWEGLSVFEARVTHIALNDQGLAGTIPAGLGRLDALRVLFLQGNRLTGRIPVELGNLSSLEFLQLDRNQLSGEIPPELGKLTKLERLSFEGNDLSGGIPPELGQLENLRELILSRNSLSGQLPETLTDLIRLRGLDLHNNHLSGEIPADIGNLASLSSLQLEANRFSGAIPASLGQIRELWQLGLGGNRLSGPLPRELGNLRELRTFWAGDNQLSGSIPAELASLPKLESLNLGSNRLTGPIHEGFARLPALDFIELAGNRLRGTLPWAFKERLDQGNYYLGLDGNLITGYPPLPPLTRSPDFSASPSSNGNASHHSIAWYQGPLVMEWDWDGPRVEHQTPLLGRWAVLAVTVDHAVEDAPEVATQVLDSADAVIAESLEQVAYPATRRTGSGRWRTEYVFHLPGELFQEGNQVIHIIDPENELAETDESDNRSEPVAIDGETPPKFRVTFIPVQYSDGDPWITEADLDDLMRGTRTLLPIADDFEARLGEPLWIGPSHPHTALGRILERWNLEAEENEFFHGISDGLARGTAFLDARVALSSASIFGTIPHEFGHNLSLMHTSGCGADGPDLEYPRPNGRLASGRAGWDPDWRRWATGDEDHDGTYTSDLMSYCGDGHFISNYNYSKLVDYWLAQGIRTSTSMVTSLAAGEDAAAGAIPGVNSRRSAVSPASGGSLALSGVIDDAEVWRLDQARLSEKAPRQSAEHGDYTLLLLDSAGVRLYAEPLAVMHIKENGGRMWAARTPLPLRRAEEIVIVDAEGSEVLRQSLPEFGDSGTVAAAIIGPAEDDGANSLTGTATSAVTSGGAIDGNGCSNGDFIDNPGSQPRLVADCEVLVSFANSRIAANQAPDNHAIRQWGRGSQRKLADWRGIEVAGGRVRKIDLAGSKLRGRAPAEFARLDALEELYLQNNNLSGLIPREYGTFSGLEILNLGSNLLDGPLPLALTRIFSLRELSLHWNKLAGPIPPELSNLRQLRKLDLLQNRFSGAIPVELAQLAELDRLDLSYNDLAGVIPPELGLLRNLESLALAGNRLSGPLPKELARLRKLSSLLLEENELTGPIPSVYGEFPAMTFMTLDQNRLTGTIPVELARLPHLDWLDLQYNRLHGRIPWQFRERLKDRPWMTVRANGNMVGGYEPSPGRGENPAYSSNPASNGNASHHAIAWYQGPPILEWNWAGQRRDRHTPILGRWAALAVSVDHEVETPPPVITRVLGPDDAVLAGSLDLAAPPVTEETGQGRWRSEYVFYLPGELYREGNKVVHVIDPDNVLAETNENDNVSRAAPLRGEAVPRFRITFVPIQIENKGAEVWWENTDPEELMQGIRALMPIADDYEARIGPPMPTEAQYIGQAVQDLLALWNLQAEPDEFYHGITDLTAGGLGYTGGQVGLSTRSILRIIPHEVGHNMSLDHAPGCSAAYVDPDYPWPDGELGPGRGWDLNLRRFATRESGQYTDIMSYCGHDQFISNYHYGLASEHWRTVELGSGDGEPASRNPVAGEDRASGPPLAEDSIQQPAADAGALALAGEVDAAGQWRLIQSQYSPKTPRRPHPDGEYTLLLFDSAGVRLYAEPLALMFPGEGDGALWAARTPIPLRVAREIVILDPDGNEVLREALPDLGN